ncbi:sulfotransferase family 2 domain-containing protein [Chelatococcus reniformis]|uniref:Sulfotransferase family protein n=1 Tax=Chelatococcus reniformis TaxID=1494448 RepID=A0A916UBD6_9HYPH|nr:sulfotransferase family 2 domain-containing protein [Chelatococcus reniformis]GGC64815.1 hypothetical protein GCM10010994_24250 [Chelatococcus reniformis]
MTLARDVVFLHIPKTAGTSLRTALETALSAHVQMFDYGQAEPKTTPGVRRLCRDASSGGTARSPRVRPVFLCGHIWAADYLECFRPQSFVTFLRDPVDRVISAYHHSRRHTDDRRPFDEFVHDPEHRNLQTRQLAALPLAACGFVGFVEHYREDCAELGRRLGVRLPHIRTNTKPLVQRFGRLGVDRQAVAELNADDVALYGEALRMRNRRQARADGIAAHAAMAERRLCDERL